MRYEDLPLNHNEYERRRLYAEFRHEDDHQLRERLQELELKLYKEAIAK